MKVLFLTNIPSPYRVDFFNELGKMCELTVVFERNSSSERDDSWKKYATEHFKPVVLKGIKRGVANAICPGIIKHLQKGKYDHIIVTNFTSFTGMLAIFWMRMRKMPYWLESDGGFAKNGAGFKETLKKYFIKGAAGYFSTGVEHDKYYRQYGADDALIQRYPFTSVYKKDILNSPISRNEKLEIRKNLGIYEEKVLIAVGQFIPRKGFDILIDALMKLPSDVGCYIIGGQPTQEYLDQVKKNQLANVHFVGFQPKHVLNEYYLAADLFVHPTREDIWGLVVNEAMAKGLPVITTDRCIAGLELIQEPFAGEIIPVGDATILAEAIERALKRIDTVSSQEILNVIQSYCFEEMAKRHIDVLTGE